YVDLDAHIETSAAQFADAVSASFEFDRDREATDARDVQEYLARDIYREISLRARVTQQEFEQSTLPVRTLLTERDPNRNGVEARTESDRDLRRERDKLRDPRLPKLP